MASFLVLSTSRISNFIWQLVISPVESSYFTDDGYPPRASLVQPLTMTFVLCFLIPRQNTSILVSFAGHSLRFDAFIVFAFKLIGQKWSEFKTFQSANPP